MTMYSCQLTALLNHPPFGDDKKSAAGSDGFRHSFRLFSPGIRR
jgi:hypothetical protein